MLEDITYFDFFMNGEHFTVEDVDIYTEDAVAVFCEDSFVAEIAAPDLDLAYAAARDYCSAMVQWHIDQLKGE